MSGETDPLLDALNMEEGTTASSSTPIDPEREKALDSYKKKLIEHRQWDAKLKDLRFAIKDLDKDFDKTEYVSFFLFQICLLNYWYRYLF